MALLITTVVCMVPAHAVPQLALEWRTDQHHDHVFATVDLRSHWESAQLVVHNRPNNQAYNPQEVWGWPQDLFVRSNGQNNIALTEGQRFVARMELLSADPSDGLYLNFKMPRLDAVHVAYRYGDGPWIQKSAGDTLPMQTWPFAERQPVFDIPLQPGSLSLVVEIAHRGTIETPVVLQSASTFRQEGINATLITGLLVGVNLVLAVVGVLAAFSFRRWSFLSVTMMTLLMSCVVSANTGLVGVYLLTDSASFNDQFKYFANTAWCVLFPWVTATVLSQRLQARWWWRIAMVWAVVGVAAMFWWMPYAQRDAINKGIGLLVTSSMALSLAIVISALVRRQVHAWMTLPGVLLYAGSLMLRFAAQLNIISTDEAILYASLATLAAALIFLQVLIKQHRQGRLVMSRASKFSGRDVLTGLLNREGYERVLTKMVNRMLAEESYAAFFYIQVSDAKTLQERFGDEGFEVGIVQMAAAISSSISVADAVARVSPTAFAVAVMMPRDAKLANAMAQKIITRIMALATHVAPMAQTARIAAAWMPVFGTTLPDVERRALRTLQKMEAGKRIAWVGGAYAHVDASQMPTGLSNPTTKPNGQDFDNPHTDLPSLPGMINRLEQEMLGTDSQQLQDEALRLIAEMKKNVRQGDAVRTR